MKIETIPTILNTLAFRYKEAYSDCRDSVFLIDRKRVLSHKFCFFNLSDIG